MNVVIVGYRGTGKTTVARLVAARLSWQAIDVDDEIEATAGLSVAEIFATQGEPAFRDIEEQVLARATALDAAVISTGGGTLQRDANRQRVKQASHVVWLTASPETIHRRMSSDPATAARRPALTALGGLDEIHHLLAVRTPWYEECATLVLDSETATCEQLAARIVDQIGHEPAQVRP